MSQPLPIPAFWNGCPLALSLWGLPAPNPSPSLALRIEREMGAPVPPHEGAVVDHWAYGGASLDLEVVMHRP